jgi:hypothetical protein
MDGAELSTYGAVHYARPKSLSGNIRGAMRLQAYSKRAIH